MTSSIRAVTTAAAGLTIAAGTVLVWLGRALDRATRWQA